MKLALPKNFCTPPKSTKQELVCNRCAPTRETKWPKYLMRWRWMTTLQLVYLGDANGILKTTLSNFSLFLTMLDEIQWRQ